MTTLVEWANAHPVLFVLVAIEGASALSLAFMVVFAGIEDACDDMTERR